MHALQVAAQFAAFTWYSNANPETTQDAAARFARTNWPDFLAVAHEGVGRLLLQIADKSAKRKPKKDQRRLALAR